MTDSSNTAGLQPPSIRPNITVKGLLPIDGVLYPLWERIRIDTRIVPLRQCVAAAILKTYRETGVCMLNSVTLGKLAGVSHGTATRAIRDLVKFGYLRRTGHTFDQGLEPVVITDPNKLTLPFPPARVNFSSERLKEGTRAGRLMAKIESNETLTKTAKTIARIMLSYYERTGRHMHRSTNLARYAGCKPRTVFNAKEALCSAGYFVWSVTKKRRSGPLVPCFEEDGEMKGTLDQQHVDRGYQLTPTERFDQSKTIGFDGSGVFMATCGKCGDEIQAGHTRDRRLPSEAVLQMFRKKGWHVHQRKPKHNLCATCFNPPKPAAKEEIAMPPVIPTHAPAPLPSSGGNGVAPTTAATAASLPRPLTPMECRKVNALLEIHFDADRGRYEPSWDDERIGIEANAPRASVTKYRDEAFGKLKTFDDIEKVLSELHTLKAMASDLEKQVIVIRNRRLTL